MSNNKNTERLTITNGVDSFSLDKSECINLELKLNLSQRGKQYVLIGDYLYNYGAKYYTSSRPASLYIISNVEYEYLLKLKDLSYDDIKNGVYNGKPII
jgi:hypothetical protein